MFKIPEKIKIGFVDYRIEDVQRLSGEKMIMGEHFEEHACIQLASHINQYTKAKTFVHECLHAVMAEYGISIDNEELLVARMATGITEIIDQIVEFNSNSRPKFGTELIHGICEVDRVLTPLLCKEGQRALINNPLPFDFERSKEDDPNGFCAMVAHTRRIAELLKEQLDNPKEKE